MKPRAKKIPKQVRSAVHDALELLEDAEWEGMKNDELVKPDSLPSLLDRCGKLAWDHESEELEPVRTIHHLACTGGTLITKCLACSPNVQVLSEVDPLSDLSGLTKKFAPGDILSLVKFSNREISQEQRVELFLAGLDQLYATNRSKGLHLLLRDHAHSHFCVGDSLPVRPSLKEIVEKHHTVKSVVTVRHPVDSYLSLRANEWVQFEPPTINGYAVRYLAFLDSYATESHFYYEDFLDNPDKILDDICSALDLSFPDGYRDLFSVHSFSGDSGRTGSQIFPRKRRSIEESLRRELRESAALAKLCDRLGYELDV